ncbi:putative adenylate kinase [Rosa chinensis]|uniref:Putative adenylate kinase n=1 Tax=Rosa chinensis TaxID=74649 RepID=A0A2P6SIX0_ROSCH|nr:putative adenylate kinase [Rosa chinensis]
MKPFSSRLHAQKPLFWKHRRTLLPFWIIGIASSSFLMTGPVLTAEPIDPNRNPESQPVEEFYRSRGKLSEFDLIGGIPESWPKQHDLYIVY